MDEVMDIRNLGRHAEGYWIAEVRLHESYPWTPVHRGFGSWMTGHGAAMRDIRADVAAELQTRVHKLEKKERQAA